MKRYILPGVAIAFIIALLLFSEVRHRQAMMALEDTVEEVGTMLDRIEETAANVEAVIQGQRNVTGALAECKKAKGY